MNKILDRNMAFLKRRGISRCVYCGKPTNGSDIVFVKWNFKRGEGVEIHFHEKCNPMKRTTRVINGKIIKGYERGD